MTSPTLSLFAMSLDQPIFSYLSTPGIPTSASGNSIFVACTAFVFLVLVVWIFMLGSRVVRLSSRVSDQGTAILKLVAELEVQALLTRQMSIDLEEIRRPLLGREETAKPEASPWASAGAPVNLNRRGQILRLSSKGKSVAEIAQDLHVAQGEVELLLKVHDLGQKNPSQESTDVLSQI